MPTVEFEEKCKNIREESKSIYEVIEKTKDLLLLYGVKFSLLTYPSRFSISVKNTHSAPINYKTNWCSEDISIPTSYPGWSGNWIGRIDVIDSKKAKPLFGKKIRPTLSDLTKLITFINIGSGSCGDNFDISGTIWLYDFPLIHEENMRTTDLDKNILVLDYNKCLDSFSTKHRLALKNHIRNNDISLQIETTQNSLREHLDNLQNAKELNDQRVRNDFNEAYTDTLPLPPQEFGINPLAYVNAEMSMRGDTKDVLPQCLETLERTKEVIERMEQLIIDSPELFI